jgi:tetratricopeptide (TPR) repeat protein
MYLDARGRHDAQQYASLREQSRPGEARSLLLRILMLNPTIRQEGRLLRSDLRELDQTIEFLLQETSTEVSPAFSFNQRLVRARQLAMLGRTNEAVEMLLELPETNNRAEACTLLGTIHENRHDWNSALHFYSIAKNLLKSSPTNAGNSFEEYQITMGSAYCWRRLGQLNEARVSYLKLLEIDPGADTHFLLAQFFEDIQETSSAQHHALMSMQFDPKRYASKSGELIRRLQAHHFRCLSVYQDSKRAATKVMPSAEY